ncbi:MAG: hypothetical protein LBJ13_02440 [Puniceicoccales bacterium]|nr:hypothetical protein [Puniceicoccales bacterium]
MFDPLLGDEKMLELDALSQRSVALSEPLTSMLNNAIPVFNKLFHDCMKSGLENTLDSFCEKVDSSNFTDWLKGSKSYSLYDFNHKNFISMLDNALNLIDSLLVSYRSEVERLIRNLKSELQSLSSTDAACNTLLETGKAGLDAIVSDWETSLNNGVTNFVQPLRRLSDEYKNIIESNINEYIQYQKKRNPNFTRANIDQWMLDYLSEVSEDEARKCFKSHESFLKSEFDRIRESKPLNIGTESVTYQVASMAEKEVFGIFTDPVSAKMDLFKAKINESLTSFQAAAKSEIPPLFLPQREDTLVSRGLVAAFTDFRDYVIKAKAAADAAKYQAQAKRLLTEMNVLESGYKNWRSDPVEHQGMINAVKNLMVKPGSKTDEVNPSYYKLVDVVNNAVNFNGNASILNKIYNYVDQYKVNGSLYSIWRNSTVSSTNQTPYNATLIVSSKTVSARMIELQTLYSGWIANPDTRMRLLKECYATITDRGFDTDRPKSMTEEDFAKSKVANVNAWGNLADYRKAFAYIFKTVLEYPILQLQLIPPKCIPKVVGTTENIMLLPRQTILQNNVSTTKVVGLTPIEKSSDFVAPSQDAIPTMAWESAKIVLDNLKHTGEDSFETYVKNQSSELGNLTNRIDKNGFHKITQLLNELKEKIDIFRVRSSSTDRSIALALVKWYNAVVDHAAQYIKINLQEYINNSAHLNSKDWSSVGEAQKKNQDDTITKLTADTSWSIQSATNENTAVTAAAKTMLKYIRLNDNNEVKYTFPCAGTGLWVANGSTILGQIQTLQSGFKNQTVVTAALINDLSQAQQQLENLLQQYNALTEEQKRGYNSMTIRAYIQNLKTIVTTNFGDLNASEQFQPKGNIVLAESTKKMYKELLENLNNLRGALESIVITRDVKTFEDWFIKIEKIYYDWRINSKNRKKLLEQLDLFKKVTFEFQLPSAIANDEELLIEKVEIRSANKMGEMMGEISKAIVALNSILRSATANNPLSTTALQAIEAVSKSSGYLKNARIKLAEARGEFHSMDDWFTCSNVIEDISAICQDMHAYVNSVPQEKLDQWRETTSSNDVILQMTSSSLYFSNDILDHIVEIEAYIKQHDVAKDSGAVENYHKIANRYGYTGNCDADQVAIIRQLNIINGEIEKEFEKANPYRGANLLSAKISGQPVTFAVDSIGKSIDRCTKYYEAWVEFERYASYLVTNFITNNPTSKNSLVTGEQAIIERIRNGTDPECKTLLDLFEKYTPIATGGSAYESLLYKLKTISAANEKTAKSSDATDAEKNLLNIFNQRKFTEIDYMLQPNDFKVDALKMYKDLFIEDISIFKKLCQYISGQNAYTVVTKYVDDLFNQFPSWRNNGEQNSNLRRYLSSLKSSALYRTHEPVWQIASALSADEQTEAVKNSKESCYLADITAIVTNTSLGSSEEGTLADYVAALINYVYGYNALADPRAIYASRVEEISDTVQTVLGMTTVDYSVLFNISSETLIVGGQLIPDADKMAYLIITLEDLVKKWNRDDEGAMRTVIEAMNPDGTFFLQSDSSYQLQAQDAAMPKDGTVKIIAGESTTINVYVDGAISSTTTSATVKNRLVTNELLDVVDSLKNIYVNGPLFRSVSEIYYRLKMAEYLHSIVGKTIKNVVWHSPTNDLVDQTNRTFLASQGCYTFTMGDNSQVFLCGRFENGTMKISRLSSDFKLEKLKDGIEGNVLNATAEEMADLRRQLAQKNSSIQQKETEITNVNRTISQLTSQKAQCGSLSLEAALAQLKDAVQKSGFQTQLNGFNSTINTKRSEISKLEAEISPLEAQLSQLEAGAGISPLEAQLSQLVDQEELIKTQQGLLATQKQAGSKVSLSVYMQLGNGLSSIYSTLKQLSSIGNRSALVINQMNSVDAQLYALEQSYRGSSSSSLSLIESNLNGMLWQVQSEETQISNQIQSARNLISTQVQSLQAQMATQKGLINQKKTEISTAETGKTALGVDIKTALSNQLNGEISAATVNLDNLKNEKDRLAAQGNQLGEEIRDAEVRKRNPLYDLAITANWFLSLKDELGVFYALDDNGKVSATEFGIKVGGKSYYSLGGSILDGDGKAMMVDTDGFIIDPEGIRIVQEITVPTGSVYTAYKLDAITGNLLCVPYDKETKSEKTKASVDDSGNFQEYSTRFGAYNGWFFSHADYLKDEDIHSLFVEEVNNIGISFGIMHESWKVSASSSAFSDATKTFSAKFAQFAGMFSTISDMLGRHDVIRYNDSLSYEVEQQMIQGVNKMLQNTNNTDKGFQNFANIATKAKEYYDLMFNIATTKSAGNVESAKQYAKELPGKKQEYENAKLNAASEKGNFPAYVYSLEKELKEVSQAMKYALSTQFDATTRSRLITNYAFKSKKCEMAESILKMTNGIDQVAIMLNDYLDNNGLTKDFQALYTLISEGNSSYSEIPILSLPEVWEVEKNAKFCIYEGWKGDSRDAMLFRDSLSEFKKQTYFQKAEERALIASESVRDYLNRMESRLDIYAEELKKYETYDGILNDVYVMDVIKYERKRKIAGLGFNGILANYSNWVISKSKKAALLKELNQLSENLDWIITSYGKNGALAGTMDPILLQKIKSFSAWLGAKNDSNWKTYIGRVVAFETYDSNKISQDQYMYKIQSAEINEIFAEYAAKEIDAEEYKAKIDQLSTTRNGPLDTYIMELQDYLSYSQQLELYQRSLLDLIPKPYVFFRSEWKEQAGIEQGLIEKETNGEVYYRLISGYGRNGTANFIEDYDPNDDIIAPVFIAQSSLWHGDYSNYGVLFRLMAILYEKFTTQKNLLADLLKQIQENNERIAEANKYLAKINKTQAQAARQGENARAVIPVDVIIFFKKKGLTMPTEFFGNTAEIGIYENSNFSKRMDYLDIKGGGLSNLFSYVSQGRLKSGDNASSNMMLADLSNRDLLELGSFKEIYDQTDYADANFSDVSSKVKGADPVAGLIIAMVALAVVAAVVVGALATVATGGLAIAALVALAAGAAASLGAAIGVGIECAIHGKSVSFHATDNIVAGDKDKLLGAYWYNRMQVKENDDTAQVKTTLGTYTQALMNSMDGDYPPFPCSLEGVTANKKGSYGTGCDEPATNGFQLNGWAPASMGWGLTGHYKYLANKMGDASGGSSRDFTSGSNQWMVEAFDMLAHQKYYKQKKGVFKENYTEPDYDYNALILMYKLEALAEIYGDEISTIAVNYLTGQNDVAKTIEALDAFAAPELGDQALSLEDVKMIKTYIDGSKLFTEDEDILEYEKKTITQCWTENDSIKAVLNKLYSTGSKGLNADEVSLWSEGMRIYIDKITTDGQTLTTKMQRIMQRCNETTSLATQMLKSMGDSWKQVTSNIR